MTWVRSTSPGRTVLGRKLTACARHSSKDLAALQEVVLSLVNLWIMSVRMRPSRKTVQAPIDVLLSQTRYLVATRDECSIPGPAPTYGLGIDGCNIPSNCDRKAFASFSRGIAAELVAVTVSENSSSHVSRGLRLQRTGAVGRGLVPAVLGSSSSTWPPLLLLVLVVCRHGDVLGIFMLRHGGSTAEAMSVRGRRAAVGGTEASKLGCLVSRGGLKRSESATAPSESSNVPIVQRSPGRS